MAKKKATRKKAAKKTTKRKAPGPGKRKKDNFFPTNLIFIL